MKLLLDVAIPAITFFLLGAVGLDLTTADFQRVARQPRIVLAGLVAPMLLLPPLAVGLLALFRPSPATAAGLLLIAVCPIGGISNTYSMLARASTALSVSLTGVSCLLAVVTIPGLAAFFTWALNTPLDLAPPVRVLALQVLVVLGLPVSVGMAVRHWFPAFASSHLSVVRRAGFLALALLILLVMYGQWTEFAREIGAKIGLAASFVALSFSLGWILARALACDARDRFTLSAEFATRNVTVAVGIAVTILGRVEFAAFATTYFLTEAPLLVIAILLFRASHGTARGSAPLLRRSQHLETLDDIL
jgi:BASS family bile acid:Na+ symporter